jgi:large subunit ribosomal protein L25
MTEITLAATPRVTGKKQARDLRNEDLVPGVFYGKNQDPVHFSVQRLALRPVIHTAEARTVSLHVEGKSPVKAVLRDVTFDPISDKILHFDLLGIKEGDTFKTQLPVHLTGMAAGVRDGGTLDHVMTRIRVKVDPTKMPENITIDVSSLKIGDSVKVSDLQFEGVTFVERPGAVLAAVLAPKGSAKETPEATKKGKK